MMKNPFEVAKPVAKKLKVLLYGPSGSGKTLAALSFPDAAVIDSEAGTDLYAGRPGVPAFSVLRARTISDLENAIKFIQEDGGKTFKTLVIDPLTTFYDVQKEATARQAKTGELGFREWAKINNRMKAVYNALTNLPVHVVVIAREATEYETIAGELKKTGVKPDCDKSISYAFDLVIRMNPDHSGTIQKSRGQNIGKNGVLAKVDWSAFEPVASAYTTGETITVISEDKAAELDADSMQDKDIATAFIAAWREKSISDRDVLTALKVARLSEWTAGRKAADDAVQAWVNAQISLPPAQPKFTPAPVQSNGAASLSGEPFRPEFDEPPVPAGDVEF